jgi:peptide deformylase
VSGKKRGKQHLKKRKTPTRVAREVVNFYEYAWTLAKHADFLRQRAVEVGKLTQRVVDLAGRIRYVVEHDPNCLGIAAPQVGHSIRLIVLQHTDERVSVWFDPEIIPDTEGGKMREWEGCFSLPDERVYVERWLSVTLRGMWLDGQMHEERLAGKTARAAQHEVDHLDGVLIIDHGDAEPVKGDVIATGEKLAPLADADMIERAVARG